MSLGPGDAYTAVVGPVRGDNLPAGEYDVNAVIVARDTAGNEGKRSATFGKAVRHCPRVIG